MARPVRTAQQHREGAEARRERRAGVTDPDVIMAAATAFLSVRPRSVDETRRRLDRLGYPSALCDQVVARLLELGYLDDVAFARAWIESRDRVRPRGTAALRQELRRKGIAGDTIMLLLTERAEAMLDTTSSGAGATAIEREAARHLLARRSSSLRREPDPRRRRQKAYALLARNGFPPDVCQEVAASVVDVSGDEATEAV